MLMHVAQESTYDLRVDLARKASVLEVGGLAGNCPIGERAVLYRAS
jgi:hypothetical protein